MESKGIKMKKSKRNDVRKNAEKLDCYRKNLREIIKREKQKSDRIIARRLAHKKTNPFSEDDTFNRVVWQKAPKLLKDGTCFRAVQNMGNISSIRQVEDWNPQQKSYRALLVSLANHLFASYPMPPYIWSVFWSTPDLSLAKLVTRIAYGVSVYSLSKNKELGVVLSKKQCHQLMSLPAKFSFIDSIRFIQLQGCGGSRALFNEWRRSRYVSSLQSFEMEQFGTEVLGWLCKQDDIRPKSVVPLMEYLYDRKSKSTTFSIKGRSLGKTIAAMEEWQHQERLRKLLMGIDLPESGLVGAAWSASRNKVPNDKPQNYQWSVTEILSMERLLAEGKEMNHCVYSYRNDIKKGRCSIWSVSQGIHKKLTIEVNNRNKQIVQVKGKYNREPHQAEWQAVRKWASLNGVRC